MAPSFLHPATLFHSPTAPAGSCIADTFAFWVPASQPGQSCFVSQQGGNLPRKPGCCAACRQKVRKDIKASSVTFWDTNSYLPFTTLLCSYIASVEIKKELMAEGKSYTQHWSLNIMWFYLRCHKSNITHLHYCLIGGNLQFKPISKTFTRGFLTLSNCDD